MHTGIPNPKYTPRTADTTMRPVYGTKLIIIGAKDKNTPASIQCWRKRMRCLNLFIKKELRMAEMAIPKKLTPNISKLSVRVTSLRKLKT
jgi:hypothetical protein